MTTDPVIPALIAVPEQQLDELRSRLFRTRWPEAETVNWLQGAPLAREQPAILVDEVRAGLHAIGHPSPRDRGSAEAHFAQSRQQNSY